MTYDGQLQTYAVAEFPREEGQTFTILKPKTDGSPKDKVDYVQTEYPDGRKYWLLRNNTRGVVQYEVQITP